MYTTNGTPHFFRQIGQYLTFIARTTILHRQPFFYPHGLNKKKREVVSNFFRTFAIWKLLPPYRFTEYGSADEIATTILKFEVYANV